MIRENPTEQKPMEYKAFGFEAKANSEEGTFEGYANTFYCLDTWGDIVAPGAFEESLPEFLKTGFVAGIGHDWMTPIGKPLEAKEDAKGLFVKGKVSETTAGKDALILLRDGVLTKMSIGYRTKQSLYLETAQDVLDWWYEHNYTPSDAEKANAQWGARVLLKVQLFEFCPVLRPANAQADITGVKEGSLAALTLTQHAEAVLAAVEAFQGRVVGLKALREQDGRTLSEARRAELGNWLQVMEEKTEAVRALLSKTPPKAQPELQEFLISEAQRLINGA